MFVTILWYVSVIILSLIGLIFIYYNKAFSYWKNRGVPHLPPTFPFGNVTSNVTKFTGQIIADLYHRLKQNGYQYAGAYIFASPVFISISPKINKFIMMQNFEQFRDHGIYINLEKDKMAANLLTYSGKEWKQMRMKVTPAFTPGKVKLMFPLMVDCFKGYEEILMEAARKSEYIDMWDFAGRYFTDIIGSCAFGINCNCAQNPDAEFRHYGKLAVGQTLPNLIRLRLAMSASYINRMFNINMFPPTATDFFKKVVDETIAYRVQNNIQRADLLDNLIRLRKKQDTGDDNNEGLTDTQIAAMLFLYYLAGFETSATAAAFGICELADNPDVQNKVRNELLQVLKKDGGVLTYEGITSMKYLDKVVSESLRKYPSVLMISRMCTETVQVPETNISIEKGTRTIIPVLGLHNDPEYYPNPSKFDPERFSEEEIAKRPPFTYLPFGEGPRICPGIKFGTMQVKLFLTSLIKNYRFSLHPSFKMPIKTYTAANLLHPLDRILLNVEKI